MDLDGLLRIGDVQPAAVRFPAFGQHLNQNAAHGRVGNMGDTFAIGLDVQFQRFVFLDGMLFDVFDINAGVFDGLLFIAAGDFNGDTVLGIDFGCGGSGLGGRSGRILRDGVAGQQE